MKQYAVIFTPRAERQLAHLYGYIADQSGEARAENYVGKIAAACHALSTFPSAAVNAKTFAQTCEP